MAGTGQNGGQNGSNGNAQPPRSRSVVDQGTTFKGAITSSSTVVVLGVLEGEVTGPAVEVEAGGVVVGKLKVGELRSRGELAGEFDADDVELSGRVRDGTVIRAKALLVAPAAGAGPEAQATFGECQIEVGELPAIEQAKQHAVSAALAGRPLPEGPRPAARAEAPAEPEADAGASGPRRRRTPTERPSEGA
jgi:cytoskeletal protein CcmA (bactofilin family)